MRSSARPLALVALALLTGCLASTVVEPGARAVTEAEPELDWRPAEANDVGGLYESLRLEGEAAAALWKLYYHFGVDGTYTGAALVFDGERAAFQTLSGTWSLAGGQLELDGGEVSTAAVAGAALRIESASGAVHLRRVSDG